eukprot:Lithocolla_globosa_v1_NODE_6336_length_1102_cov_48.858644.p2 type:complete len:149 gc:universal NODE_6336_length_1102_cov_48.858644:492-46(-)
MSLVPQINHSLFCFVHLFDVVQHGVSFLRVRAQNSLPWHEDPEAQSNHGGIHLRSHRFGPLDHHRPGGVFGEKHALRTAFGPLDAFQTLPVDFHNVGTRECFLEVKLVTRVQRSGPLVLFLGFFLWRLLNHRRECVLQFGWCCPQLLL